MKTKVFRTYVLLLFVFLVSSKGKKKKKKHHLRVYERPGNKHKNNKNSNHVQIKLKKINHRSFK